MEVYEGDTLKSQNVRKKIFFCYVGRCGEVWGGVERCGEVWGGVERCGEVWGGVERCGEGI